MRKLNGRFHIEGEQIVKTSNGQPIPPEEPVFLFRGRDWLTVAALEFYYDLCVSDQCNNEHLDDIWKCIEEFKDFAAAYPERMKQPNVTKGK